MSNFDYMNFGDGGYVMEFVVHAKKFTKEEAVELCVDENDWKFNEEYCGKVDLRKPTIDDITENTVRWYPRVPENCAYEGDGGCYTYCKKGERGSFPVWVIEFDNLK